MTNFHGDEAKKKFFFRNKKIKMADSKKLSFPTSPKAQQFPPKFHGLVLGLVGLIDAKGIHFAQPMWSSGCPTETQFTAKKPLRMQYRLKKMDGSTDPFNPMINLSNFGDNCSAFRGS